MDGTNHTVFTFTSDDSGTTGALASAAVVQANVQSSAPAQLARQGIGKKGNSNIRAGAFTDAYFTTPSTGYLYACGRGNNDAQPTLYRFGFNSATPPVMQGKNGTELTLTTGSAECSPLSELKNGTTDRLLQALQSGAAPCVRPVVASSPLTGSTGPCPARPRIQSARTAGPAGSSSITCPAARKRPAFTSLLCRGQRAAQPDAKAEVWATAPSS